MRIGSDNEYEVLGHDKDTIYCDHYFVTDLKNEKECTSFLEESLPFIQPYAVLSVESCFRNLANQEFMIMS